MGSTQVYRARRSRPVYGRTRKGHVYMTCDYGRTYGKVAADEIVGHGQRLSIREDALVPLVERFFSERIFGPMRLDKLARQMREGRGQSGYRNANSCEMRSPTSTPGSASRSRRSRRESSLSS